MRVLFVLALFVGCVWVTTALPMSRFRQRTGLSAGSESATKLCTPALMPTVVTDAAMNVQITTAAGVQTKLQQKNIWAKTGDPAIPAYDYRDDPPETPGKKKYLEANSAGKMRLAMNEMMSWAASTVQSSFKQIVTQFVAEEVKLFGGLKSKVVAAVAKPKATDSAWEKVARDYHCNYLRLLDAVRASVIYQNVDDMKLGVCRFATYLASYSSVAAGDCKIVQFKDNSAADGYKDMNLSIMCTYDKRGKPHPYIAEVQFHACPFIMGKQGNIGSIREVLRIPATPPPPEWDAVKHLTPIPLWNIKENGHALYEASRVIPDSDLSRAAAKATLKAKMVWLYSTAAMGSDSVKASCKVEDAPKFDQYDEFHYWEADP